MRKNIEKLLNSNMNGYYIANETGVAASVISRLRSGERTIDKLSLETAEKLSDFYEGFVKCDGYTKMYPDYFWSFVDENYDEEAMFDGEKYLNVEKLSDDTWNFDIIEFFALKDCYAVKKYEITNLEQKTKDLQADLQNYESTLVDESVYYVFDNKEKALKHFEGAKDFDEWIN